MLRRNHTKPDYSNKSDIGLITLSRAGDCDAFTEIIRRRHAKIRKYMRYLCGHAADGDDLTQQVLIRAWQGIKRLKEAAAFDGWLRRIMMTTWIDSAKRRKLDFADETDVDSLPAQGDSAHGTRDLLEALATLSHGARVCVVMAYHDGYTHDEISAITGLPAGTVKSHIQRGAARLRAHLESSGEMR